jgi:two-component system NtrC family sensor kinase
MLFDINNAIRESLVIAKNECQDVATVVLHLEELPQVMCDPSMINQVLLNLIINSVHAIKSQNRISPGTIEIKTWATSENVFCSITDDGTGISEEVRMRVFEPFFTTKELGKGTGLGLSISYDIVVHKHQGSISAECLPEGGSVFTFSLPLKH